MYSAKHDDHPIQQPNSLAENLLLRDNTKAYLLNNFLQTYFFRAMAYVSVLLST